MGKNTRVGMDMDKILYPQVYMGNPTSRIFFNGYGYGMVLPDGYVPVAIPTYTMLLACWAPTLRPRRGHLQQTALKGTAWIINVGSMDLGMYLLKPISCTMVRLIAVFPFHIRTWIHGMIALNM